MRGDPGWDSAGWVSAHGGWMRRLTIAAVTVLSIIGIGSTVFQAGPQARRILAKVMPGVPGPFQTSRPPTAELTQPVLRGLLWLRTHSSNDVVVAVNSSRPYLQRSTTASSTTRRSPSARCCSRDTTTRLRLRPG